MLPTDFEEIRHIPYPIWKNNVTAAIEIDHRNRLKDDCFKKEEGHSVPKTKTATIIPELDKSMYVRNPKKELLLCTKNECKIIIMARYGMLECGVNYKGTLNT